MFAERTLKREEKFSRAACACTRASIRVRARGWNLLPEAREGPRAHLRGTSSPYRPLDAQYRRGAKFARLQTRAPVRGCYLADGTEGRARVLRLLLWCVALFGNISGNAGRTGAPRPIRRRPGAPACSAFNASPAAGPECWQLAPAAQNGQISHVVRVVRVCRPRRCSCQSRHRSSPSTSAAATRANATRRAYPPRGVLSSLPSPYLARAPLFDPHPFLRGFHFSTDFLGPDPKLGPLWGRKNRLPRGLCLRRRPSPCFRCAQQ